MKLYATTTSERGKPALKGGNEYLSIEITEGNRNIIYTIQIENRDDEIALILNNCISGEKIIFSVPQQ